jgi:DNA-binding CsgD family transcriptional regulator
MSSYEDAIEITNKLFDEMPRGLVVVTVEGELVVASRMTRQLIETGRLFKSSEKYLEFDDPEIQGAFEEQLGSIAALPADALEKYVWHKNLTGTTGPDSYTASLLAFRYQNWKLESTACDRVAVLVINNQKLIGVPAIEHIREFYRLTNAQARVVTALFKGESVEEASTALNISPNTVRSHLRAIYSKLGVANKAALLQLVSTTTTGNRLASKIMG